MGKLAQEEIGVLFAALDNVFKDRAVADPACVLVKDFGQFVFAIGSLSFLARFLRPRVVYIHEVVVEGGCLAHFVVDALVGGRRVNLVPASLARDPNKRSALVRLAYRV